MERAMDLRNIVLREMGGNVEHDELAIKIADSIDDYLKTKDNNRIKELEDRLKLIDEETNLRHKKPEWFDLVD